MNRSTLPNPSRLHPLGRILVMLFLVLAPLARAQFPAFDCGSDGSYGPMNITTSTTLPLPPDGIFRCTTVTIASGSTLKFARNNLNTPVYILATGDVTIAGGATIDVSGGAPIGAVGGAGGPGGFDGGYSDAAGQGPGGGAPGTAYGGNASYRTAGSTSPTGRGLGGSNYGNRLILPLVGGSGGAGKGTGGSGGGGAILIASNTSINFAPSGFSAIHARGGSGSAGPGYQGGYGSGGAVRLVAPRISGTLSCLVDSLGSAAGRFRIDSFQMDANISGNTPDAMGRFMTIFPATQPMLTIASATGTDIPEDQATPVILTLPNGSPLNQTIRVRARDFGTVVPIRVRLTPETGDAVEVDAEINNTITNPATVDVPVQLPADTAVTVLVYTR